MANESLESLSDSLDSEPVVNEGNNKDGANKSRGLPYPFIIKDKIIRNSVLLKLNKKLPLTAIKRLSVFMGIYVLCQECLVLFAMLVNSR